MAKRLVVLTAPDPRLKVKAKPVDEVTDDIRQLMDDMVETLYAEDAVGLAATQVGVDKRVIVMDVNWTGDDDRQTYRMANPEILWLSDDLDTIEEACLSVPEQRVKVSRPAAARIRYLDEHNQRHEIDADGLLAKCVQHEIDHLNGKLIFDHASKIRRDIILKKLTRLKKMDV